MINLLKKYFTLLLTAVLCLGLTACGSSDEPKSNGNTTGSDMEPVTDMAFLDGMWSINGTTKLYFDSEGGYYVYRSYYGLGGRGDFYEVDGKPMIQFNGFLYDFLLRKDGVLLTNQNGDDDDSFAIHRHTFRRDDEAEINEWELDNFDGMWQNAVGETIVIDAALGQYIACSPDYSMNGTINDEGEGMGLYLYDGGRRAYLCSSDDGNSFTISGGDYTDRYGDDGQFDGVFYRNGDVGAYADLSQSEFYYEEGSASLWYFDGVNDYFLGSDYEIGEDGLAYYTEDGKVYPAGWLPEQPYDPAVDWGEDWMDN